MDLDLIRSLAVPATTKIVLLSADGLGGFPDPATGLSELETARIPHLDALARRGACGLLRHVGPRHHPGQRARAPRPLRLRAAPLPGGARRPGGPGDRLRPPGRRRRRARATSAPWTRPAASPTGGPAGSRPSGAPRWWSGCAGSGCPGSSSSSSPSRSTASCWCCAGPGSRAASPRRTPRPLGQPPLPVHAQAPEAQATADLVNRFVAEARPLLADAAPANMVLLRGFDQRPALPRFPEVYGAPRGGDRRLSDVPRARAAGRHGRAQDRAAPSRTRCRRSRTTGTPTTSSSSTTRTPTRRGRTGTSRARWRRSSGSTPRSPRSRPSARTSSSSAATTRPPQSSGPFLAPGARRAGRPVRAARRRGALLRAGLRGGQPRDAAGPRPHAARPGPRPAPDQVRRLIGRAWTRGVD